MTGWWIPARRPAELIIKVPGASVSALPQITRVLEKCGATTQELQGPALTAALPARKILGWEYGKKHFIRCTFKAAPGGSQDTGGLVAICDLSIARGRKRPFGYVWSAATVVIGVMAARRGVTTEGLVAFLVALLGPWVILQLIFFLDCLRVRAKVLRLIGSIG
jgi:hypothetical protein